MVIVSSSIGGHKLYKKIMIFIDGGYLREGVKNLRGYDAILYQNLSSFLRSLVSHDGKIGDLIRVFYYDARIEYKEDQEKHEEQEKYFDNIRRIPYYDVKLGSQIKSKGGHKQKGVDVLLAIDMITKAYQEQYDIVIFVGGDYDFLHVINAVKDAGKNVYGVFFKDNIRKELMDSFDIRHVFTWEDVDLFIDKSKKPEGS